MDVTALLRRNQKAPSLSVRPGSASVAISTDIGGRQRDERALDDAELARRVAQNDRQAAAALITRYQAQVRTFLVRITGKPDLADDLAQETFVRVLRYAHRYDPRYPMKTWLYTIARRLMLNHLRDHRRLSPSDQFDQHPSSQQGPEESATRSDQKHWMRGLLESAMTQLTMPQREVLLLFYHQDQSVEQIADAMQMPCGTVKSHLHRARTTLRKLLAPQWETLQP